MKCPKSSKISCAEVLLDFVQSNLVEMLSCARRRGGPAQGLMARKYPAFDLYHRQSSRRLVKSCGLSLIGGRGALITAPGQKEHPEDMVFVREVMAPRVDYIDQGMCVTEAAQRMRNAGTDCMPVRHAGAR